MGLCSHFRIPVRTIFDGAGGVVVIAMSPDSQYMATISASKLQASSFIRCSYVTSKVHFQVVSIWEWTNDSSAPLCQASLGEDYSYQTHLAFHDDDPHQLVSNSEDLVVFYYWVCKIWLTRCHANGISFGFHRKTMKSSFTHTLFWIKYVVVLVASSGWDDFVMCHAGFQ